MNKLLILGFVCLLLISSIGILTYEKPIEKDIHEKIYEEFGNVGFEKGTLVDGEKIVEYSGDLKDYGKTYQGPVPKGYDLEYFRKTGETIKEGTS